MASKTVKVGSTVGLHARPATIISDAAGEFDDEIILTLVGGDEDDETDAASSLMIMAMGAEHGDEVTITSIIGRRHTGVLDCVNPSYSHSFGNTVPELLTIGTTHEPITFHGQEDQS